MLEGGGEVHMADDDADGEPILAIEAKALQNDLTDTSAAQLVQYYAVEMDGSFGCITSI